MDFRKKIGVVVDAGHPSEIKPSINRTSCSKL